MEQFISNSDLMLSIISNQWDSGVVVKRVKSLKIGDTATDNNGYMGTIRGLAIVQNHAFAWLEIPLENGRAFHYGAQITDLLFN